MTNPELVESLFKAWRGAGASVPGLQSPSDVPATVLEALAIQLKVLGKLSEAGERIGGWKIGFTSGTNRGLTDFKPFGYILESRIFTSGVRLTHATLRKCQIEPEMCVVMGASRVSTAHPT